MIPNVNRGGQSSKPMNPRVIFMLEISPFAGIRFFAEMRANLMTKTGKIDAFF